VTAFSLKKSGIRKENPVRQDNSGQQKIQSGRKIQNWRKCKVSGSSGRQRKKVKDIGEEVG